MPKQYPLQMDAKIYITDGKQVGAVTFGFPVCHIPDEDAIAEAVKKSLEALPPGFRLMDRHETYNHWLREEKNYRGPQMSFSSVAKGEWHDPNALGGFSRLFPSESDFADDDE